MMDTVAKAGWGTAAHLAARALAFGAPLCTIFSNTLLERRQTDGLGRQPLRHNLVHCVENVGGGGIRRGGCSHLSSRSSNNNNNNDNFNAHNNAAAAIINMRAF